MYTARIRMPRMGTSVHESTVVAWKKAVGDQVSKGEVLLSAESDKVEFEVEAPADGVITEILAEAEETVPVGEVLATMETETEVADETPEPEETSSDWAAPVAPLKPREKPVIPAVRLEKAPRPSGEGKTWLSPRVQRLAAAHGVGLDVIAGIQGTGAGGRVSARDVEAFIAGGGAPPRIEMSREPLSENPGRTHRTPEQGQEANRRELNPLRSGNSPGHQLAGSRHERRFGLSGCEQGGVSRKTRRKPHLHALFHHGDRPCAQKRGQRAL